MSAPVRVLFTSAGRRAGLVACFRQSAEALGHRIEVHACDLSPGLSAACLAADHAFQVPRCTDAGYIDALLQYCDAQAIGLLVPTIDTELAVLAQSADRFAAHGTRVHVGSEDYIEVIRDKGETCARLARAGLAVPRTFTLDDLRAPGADLPWPLFAKPAGGSASRGLAVLEGPGDVERDYPEPMIFQEFLRGPEYTINVFVDRDGQFRAAVPHLRISVRAGEVEKGRTVRDPRFTRIARQLVAAIPGASGALCFQLIDDPDRGPCVFEINARFGGGYPLAHASGAVFARWLLEEITGQPGSAHDDWAAGVEMIRYDAAIFRDAEGNRL